MKHGIDFYMVVTALEDKDNENRSPVHQVLQEDEEVQTLFNIRVHLSEYRLARRSSRVKGLWQCYKVSPKWNGSGEIDLEQFGVEIGFVFVNDSVFPIKVRATFSSQDNAYGLAGGRWFDGDVTWIAIGGFNSKWSLYKNTYEVQIVEVNEHFELEEMCSKDSYYKCLAKRFTDFDFAHYPVDLTRRINALKQNLPFFNSSVCLLETENVCYPFSLPMIESKKLHVCDRENYSQRICYEEVISSLKLDQEKHCRKLCHKKEYKVKLSNYELEHHLPSIKFAFRYNFELPESNLNVRSEKPFKIVRKEYWIVSGMDLVGSVGGTLGLFVGFSFMDTINWFISKIFTTLWTWKRRKWLIGPNETVEMSG